MLELFGLAVRSRLVGEDGYGMNEVPLDVWGLGRGYLGSGSHCHSSCQDLDFVVGFIHSRNMKKSVEEGETTDAKEIAAFQGLDDWDLPFLLLKFAGTIPICLELFHR